MLVQPKQSGFALEESYREAPEHMFTKTKHAEERRKRGGRNGTMVGGKGERGKGRLLKEAERLLEWRDGRGGMLSIFRS